LVVLIDYVLVKVMVRFILYSATIAAYATLAALPLLNPAVTDFGL